MKIYQDWLYLGLGHIDFFELTFAEINLHLKAASRRMKDDYFKIYTQANLTSAFIAHRLNGDKIPTFDEAFPMLITEEDKQQQEKDNLEKIRKTMLAFVEGHNAQFNRR